MHSDSTLEILEDLPETSLEQQIADVRFSVTVPSNSAAAVHYAVNTLHLSRVLVEPIFSPAKEISESGIFFGFTFCPEVMALGQMPIMDWLTTVSRKHDLPRADSLDDLLDIDHLSELWLYLTFAEHHLEHFVSFLKKDFPKENRIVLVSQTPLPDDIPYRRADPSGKGDFFLCEGSLADKFKHIRLWRKSVALRDDGHSVVKTKTVL